MIKILNINYSEEQLKLTRTWTIEVLGQKKMIFLY